MLFSMLACKPTEEVSGVHAQSQRLPGTEDGDASPGAGKSWGSSGLSEHGISRICSYCESEMRNLKSVSSSRLLAD